MGWSCFVEDQKDCFTSRGDKEFTTGNSSSGGLTSLHLASVGSHMYRQTHNLSFKKVSNFLSYVCMCVCVSMDMNSLPLEAREVLVPPELEFSCWLHGVEAGN